MTYMLSAICLVLIPYLSFAWDVIPEDASPINLSHLSNFVSFAPQAKYYFGLDAGVEHYKLLALLSKNLPEGSLAVDLGTFYGASALAMSFNPNVKVITYDISELIPPADVSLSIRHVSNILYLIKDGIADAQRYAREASLILLDVDPHDGIQEKRFIEVMLELKFVGLVVCDDIHLNEGMRYWWDWVPLRKIDVSQYGHHSGTGFIFFD